MKGICILIGRVLFVMILTFSLIVTMPTFIIYAYDDITLELMEDVIEETFASIAELVERVEYYKNHSFDYMYNTTVILSALDELSYDCVIDGMVTLDGGNHVNIIVRNHNWITIIEESSLTLRNITFENTTLYVFGNVYLEQGSIIRNSGVAVLMRGIDATVILDGGVLQHNYTGIYLEAGRVTLLSGSIDHNEIGIDINSEDTELMVLGGRIHSNSVGVQHFDDTIFTVGGTGQIIGNHMVDVNLGVDQTFVISETHPPQPEMHIGFWWNHYEYGEEAILVRLGGTSNYTSHFVPNNPDQRVFFEEGFIRVDNVITITVYHPWLEAGFFEVCKTTATLNRLGTCCCGTYEVSNIYHVNRGATYVHMEAYTHCDTQYRFAHWNIIDGYPIQWLTEAGADQALIQFKVPSRPIAMGAFIVDQTLYNIMTNLSSLSGINNRNDADKLAGTVGATIKRYEYFDGKPPVDLPLYYVDHKHNLKNEAKLVNVTDGIVTLVQFGKENNDPDWNLRITANNNNIISYEQTKSDLLFKFGNELSENQNLKKLYYKDIKLTNTLDNNSNVIFSKDDKATIKIHVGEEYNNKKIIVLHEKTKTNEILSYQSEVEYGNISIVVDSFSRFLILSPILEDDMGQGSQNNQSGTRLEPSTEAPHTGDENKVALYVMGLMLSFATIVTVLWRRRL